MSRKEEKYIFFKYQQFTMNGCRYKISVSLVSFLKHLNSLRGKFHYCGTSPSSFFSQKRQKFSHVSLEKYL